VQGAVLSDAGWVVQPLTDMINLQFDPHDPDRMLNIGRLFYVLSGSLAELDTFYKGLLTPKPGIPKAAFWPSICQYKDVTFEYCERLDSVHLSKLVFRAKMLPNQEPIVVKFTRSYCATAHQLLESQGLAPKLRYFSGEDSSFKKPDGLDMVVMDFISEDKNLSDAGLEDVRKAIELLHNNDLVFGDLRRPNVLATPSGAMLIDFDWCGTVGGVHYPLQLNAKDIDWAPGVAAGKPILKEHDLAMLILLRGDSQIGV